MDARLDPAKYAGLSEGDAHVIRNAGGRASDDAIRSLVISYKLLGTQEWFVIHHTNCGMEFFTNEVMRDLLARASRPPRSGRTASTTSAPARARPTAQVHRLAHDRRPGAERRRRRQRGSATIRSCPSRIPIYGYIYDVETGRLVEVPAATEAGKSLIGLAAVRSHSPSRRAPEARLAHPRAWGQDFLVAGITRQELRIADLLEREESLAALHGAHSEARAGKGQLLFVAGEAGVGKTALVRSFCAAVTRSVRVLAGACDPLATPRPLGPFVEIAEETGGALADLVGDGGGAHEVARALLEDSRARRRFSSSTTCTGPTRQRWMSSVSSDAGSRPRRRSSSQRIATTNSTAPTPSGCCSASWRRRRA